MRGESESSRRPFSYVDLDSRVRDHPRRAIRELTIATWRRCGRRSRASGRSTRSLSGNDGGDDDETHGGERNRPRDFHGARRSNATHRAATDGDRRLCRKGRGKAAKLSYRGHAPIENHDGLVVDGPESPVTGQAECLAGEVMSMLREKGQRATTVACPTPTSFGRGLFERADGLDRRAQGRGRDAKDRVV